MSQFKGTEYKYVWLNGAGVNILGTKNESKINGLGHFVFEPTLDQLTEDGWSPVRELLAQDGSILIILERQRR